MKLCRIRPFRPGRHLWEPVPVEDIAGRVAAFVYRCQRCHTVGYAAP